jgi:hypothetical protein
MHNRLVDLGISVPPKLRNLDAACGWAKKTVDVMVDHTNFNCFTASDESYAAMLDGIAKRNKIRTLYTRATTSALEQCFNLYFVSRREDGHARISAYPANASGATWDDVNDELGAALFVVAMQKRKPGFERVPSWVNVVTDEYLIRIRLIDGRWVAEYEPHGLEHLPVFLAAHEPTLARPFGASRITREVMGYIDSAVRENINEEIASAFAASAQKYLLGTDGDPFEDVDRWQAYIGSIFNIDATQEGTIPQFGQLPQPSMQPLSDHFRNLCGKMSAATGIHVSQFGQVHDNPASERAIYAENSPLILKVRRWNDVASETLCDVATACIATEMGVSFGAVVDMGLQITPVFRNPSEPTLAQMTDASTKIAAIAPLFPETPTFWRMNGLSDEETDVTMREMREAAARAATNAAMSSLWAGVGDDTAQAD